MTELKLIHSRNKLFNQKGNKINNLKKIFANKGKKYESFSENDKDIKSPINSKNNLPKFHTFNSRYLEQKIPLKFPLYTFLAMKKNNLYEKIEKTIQNENNKTNNSNKITKNNFLRNREYLKTSNETSKKNIGLSEGKKDSLEYLSFQNNNFNESEKIRFYSMTKKLLSIKYFLEQDPSNKYKTLKSFLLKEGIFNKKYFKEECLNNLIKFIKSGKLMINPSYTFKDNLIQILNNKSEENFQRNSIYLNYNDYLRNKQIKNIMKLNKTIYRNKNIQFHTFENFQINRFDLDLKNNLNRQTVILKRTEKQKKYDIKKEPEKLLNSLGIQLNDQKNNIIHNINYKLNRNDNEDFGYNSDIDIFKKKHLMTEFACFIKAKDNFDLNLVKSKYNL